MRRPDAERDSVPIARDGEDRPDGGRLPDAWNAGGDGKAGRQLRIGIDEGLERGVEGGEPGLDLAQPLDDVTLDERLAHRLPAIERLSGSGRAA
jgi:hypothetical protein